MTKNDDKNDAAKDGIQGLLPLDFGRILVADDETGIRNVIARVFKMWFPAIVVDAAGNGVDAVESFSLHQQGILVMDLAMPLKDGLTACLEITELCQARGLQKPAVIFCTGYDPSSTVRDMVSQSPRHCLLRKPVSPTTLVDEIKRRLPDKPQTRKG